MYIDTHCHLDDQKFFGVQGEIIKAYLAAGVDTAINMGVNLATSVAGEKLAGEYESVYFAAGYHPSDSNDCDNNALFGIEKLAKNNKCVAIGEIGLDYHFEPYDKARQIKCFTEQIELAEGLNLPFSVHSRDATQDTLNILKDNRKRLKNGFIMHCFSGSMETAAEYIKLGGYISFGGTLTFKNSRVLKEVAAAVPVDRILTETDSPYLSPEPKRGQTNSPENIPYIVECLANIRGTCKEELALLIKENARGIFKKLK